MCIEKKKTVCKIEKDYKNKSINSSYCKVYVNCEKNVSSFLCVCLPFKLVFLFYH